MLGQELTHKIPCWVADYVGIPFEQYNCWQLVCLVYQKQFGITLCDYGKEYKDFSDRENIKKIYEREFNIWQPIEKPAFGDIIVLRILGQPWHAGIVISKRFMLHTEKNLQSIVEGYNGLIWKNNIIGYYRLPA